MRKSSTPVIILTLFLGALLTITPFTQEVVPTSSASQSSIPGPYTGYGFAALGSADRITLHRLMTETGGNLTVGGFESYITRAFVPYDLRQVLLDIGWQNYTVGNVQKEDWVNNWLTASDLTGIQNVIYVGQLTTQGIGSNWIRSAISLDPSSQTSSSNGSAVAFISYDSPEVSLFLEKDLAILYSYYGTHPSWTGIGTGSSANDPYYQSGQLFPGLGYSNLSIDSFIKSGYYSSDVNSTGYLANGQIDPLWAAYRGQPSIVLSSGGDLAFSSYADVYGNGSHSNYVEMKFQLESNLSSLIISWYGAEVGRPGPIIINLYPDEHGFPETSTPIGGATVGAATFTNITGWQTGPPLSVKMTPGYYWIVLSSPTSTDANYYSIYMMDQGNAPAYARETYVGPGLQHGSTVLWLQNQLGRTVDLYPFREVVVQPSTSQSFVASSSYSFNTVFLYLSDRIYNPTNGTLTITDLSDNITLATGVLSQQLFHGIQGSVPVSLNATVTTVAGHVYMMSISEPKAGNSWRVVVRGESVDPPSAGFQGQGAYWLFRLAFLNFAQGNLDWEDMTPNGADAVTSGYLDAVRFAPTWNEMVNSVSILMANNFLSGNYTSGTLSVSLWNSSASGLAPSSRISAELAVPAQGVPTNGWVTFSGFNQNVTGGKYFWLVFSANSNDSFEIARFTNAYTFDVQVSPNGGASWQEPREGPTDFDMVISLSNQEIGTFVASRPAVQIGPEGYFANPFIATTTTQIRGIYMQNVRGCIPIISIDGSTLSGEPSLSPITSGVLNSSDPNSGGANFVQFSAIANLKGGQRYWILIHPSSGSCGLSPIVYLPGDPFVSQNDPSMVSLDGGLTWASVSNSTSALVYELASPGIQLPRFNTSELAGVLSQFHNSQTAEGRIRGWTGYVAASEVFLFANITAWLNNQTGREFIFYGNEQNNVINQVGAGRIVVAPTTASGNTCSNLAMELNAKFPTAGVQFLNVANGSLLRQCAGSTIGRILGQLGYIRGTGEAFGDSTVLKVLVIGDGLTDNLTRYLSVAYNTTYAQLGLDPTLSGFGNLSKYEAIVWTSSQNPFLNQTILSLENYVDLGGRLILVQFGGVQNTIFSDARSIPANNGLFPNNRLGNLSALLVHTDFRNLSVWNSPSEVEGNSSRLSLLVRSFGEGSFCFVWFPGGEPAQVSDPIIVISNTISVSGGSSSPFWYNPGMTAPGVELAVVTERPGIVLVWVSNNGGRDINFSLNLNGTYYGFDHSWRVLNVNSLGIENGTSADILLEGNLLPGSWMPAYVIQPHANLLAEYSSARITDQFVYPHQSLLEFDTTKGQNVLLVISSNSTLRELLVNGGYSIPNVVSQEEFLNVSNAWMYSKSTQTLLVKFVAEGPSTLRVLGYEGPISQTTFSTLRMFFAVLVLLVCGEVAALVLLMNSRSSTRPENKSESRLGATILESDHAPEFQMRDVR